MTEQSVERKTPTKEEYLQLRAQGLSIRKIERHFGLNLNAIYPLIQKWGLKGVDAEQAQLLLDEMTIDNPEPKDEEAPAELPEPTGEGLVMAWEPAPSIETPVMAEEPVITFVDDQVSPASPRSKRTMRIEAAGHQTDIEMELLALLNYVKSMRGKSFRLELHLGEVAE